MLRRNKTRTRFARTVNNKRNPFEIDGNVSRAQVPTQLDEPIVDLLHTAPSIDGIANYENDTDTMVSIAKN